MIDTLMKLPNVKKALEFLKNDDANTLKEHLMLCAIPAPSFMEKERAKVMFEKFCELGLWDVHIDEVGNVLGTIKGSGKGPTVMIAGHLDTVFPLSTDVTPVNKNGIYYAPGINDDTRAIAELLTLIRAFKTSEIKPMGDVIFCANICEEGLGDLKGIKHIFKNRKDINAFITIDNTYVGGIVYKATGSLRYKVKVTGKGGHSYGDFGLPNPIHALGRIVCAISDFQVPKEPKTTFNVGIVEGGTSVNSIAASASIMVDLRSEDNDQMYNLSNKLKDAVSYGIEEENARWGNGEKVSASIELIGERPTGRQSKDCTIVKAAIEASEAIGIKPLLEGACSTDANIPISMGIPAIAVGRGGKGGNVHTPNEWFNPDKAYLGPQRDLLLILLIAGIEGVCNSVLSKWD